MPHPAAMHAAGTRATDRTDVVPAVVLADSTASREFDVLAELLGALDVPVVRLTALRQPVVTAPVTGGDGVLLIDGRAVRPVVAWLRHRSAAAIYAAMVRNGAAPGSRWLLVRAECWSRLLDAIAATAVTLLPGHHPGLVTQLTDAARLGVPVPRTVLTTELGAAGRRFGGAPVITKIPDSRPLALDPDPTAPRSATGAELTPAEPDASPAPLVLQEYVDHVRELRVYYTDGGVSAFEVRKPGPDSIWDAPESVTVSVADCPTRLSALVSRLAAAWGLRYGAFDFLVTSSGEPLFLEVNADGDWLWFERKARWPGVSFLVAAMVSELYSRSRDAEVVAG